VPLHKQYPADFEKVWQAYPKWPAGRSKKEPAFKKWVKVKKDWQFTTEDIDQLVAKIEENRRWNVAWQKGNKYGPPALETWLNQARWQEPYERLRNTATEAAAERKRVEREEREQEERRADPATAAKYLEQLKREMGIRH